MPRSDEDKIAKTGALIDPDGHEPQALDADEFRNLSKLLAVMRDDNKQPLHEAIDWLLYTPASGMDIKKVMQQLVAHYAMQVDEPSGFLISYPKKEIEHLSKDECQLLQEMLTTDRYGGWFPRWIALQLSVVARSTRLGDRFPSPLDVMATLTLDLSEFNEALEEAGEMIRMRPDLFLSQVTVSNGRAPSPDNPERESQTEEAHSGLTA